MSPIGQRHEDQEWVKSVEHRLVSLTSAQKQTDDDIEKVSDKIEDFERLLEGDPLDKDDSGLKGDMKDAWREIQKLKAIMAPDQLGQGGWENRLRAVEDELGIKRRGRLSRKAFAAAVGLAIVSTTAFFISNWDNVVKIAKSATAQFSDQKPSKKSKPAAKKGGTKRPRRVVPMSPVIEPEAGNDTATEGVSEGRRSDGSHGQ